MSKIAYRCVDGWVGLRGSRHETERKTDFYLLFLFLRCLIKVKFGLSRNSARKSEKKENKNGNRISKSKTGKKDCL